MGTEDKKGKGKGKGKGKKKTSPCAHLRAAYHNCFNSWYAEKFVKGHWNKEECVSEWHNYQACLSEHIEDKHLRRFLKADGLSESDTGNAKDVHGDVN